MKARFQTMPPAVKIGIAILILIAAWVLVFFVQRWIEPTSGAEAAATTPDAKGAGDKPKVACWNKASTRAAWPSSFSVQTRQPHVDLRSASRLGVHRLGVFAVAEGGKGTEAG